MSTETDEIPAVTPAVPQGPWEAMPRITAAYGGSTGPIARAADEAMTTLAALVGTVSFTTGVMLDHPDPDVRRLATYQVRKLEAVQRGRP